MATAANAHAQARIPFRVESRSESTCAAEAEFSRQLGWRTSRVRPAIGDEPALDLVIEISPTRVGLVGRLTLQEPSGAVTVREVPGANCSEIVKAIAVIAAVLIEPEVSGGRAQRGSAPPVPQASPERQPAIRTRRDGQDSAKRRPPPPALSSRAGFPRQQRWWLGAGFGAGVESAPTPRPAATLSGEVVAAMPSWLWVEAAVLHTPGVSVSTPHGLGSFSWTAVRLDGCPSGWPSSGPLALHACVLFEAGTLKAVGERTVDRQRWTVSWWASGAGLKLTARPFEPLRLVVDGSTVFPWRRYRFYFAPDGPKDTAFDIPTVGLSGRLSLAVRLL